jgi:hypothetical protein
VSSWLNFSRLGSLSDDREESSVGFVLVLAWCVPHGCRGSFADWIVCQALLSTLDIAQLTEIFSNVTNLKSLR